MNADARAVFDFWFGAQGSAERGTQRAEWFRKDAAFDAVIVQRFGALVEQAISGGLRDWEAKPAPALARILLLDQFTRNMFRDTPRAFAGDALALASARAMVARQQDRALLAEQRSFVYMPFEHAEEIGAQDEAVRLFRLLQAEAPNVTGMLDYAQRHHAVVARFGRFPHRNAVLGRESGAEEIVFLQQPRSRF